jgi:hypothetical protein
MAFPGLLPIWQKTVPENKISLNKFHILIIWDVPHPMYMMNV